MSKAIVKESLRIFDDSFKETVKVGEEKSRSQKKRKVQSNTVKFTKNFASQRKFSEKSFEQLQKQYAKNKDRTEENLRKLNALSRTHLSKDSTSSIFKRANKSREEPEIVKPVEGTVFTEEDFIMFEREYVVD